MSVKANRLYPRHDREGGDTRNAAVVWEPALTAPMPSPDVHRDQLGHILNVAQRQNVSVQVLPVSEWVPARMTSHFVMHSATLTPGSDLSFPQEGDQGYPQCGVAKNG